MPSPTPRAEKAADGSRTEAAGMTTPEMEVQIETLKAEITKLKAQLQSSGERSMDAIRNLAQEGVSHARARGEAAVHGLREDVEDFEGEIVARVREKPITSLAMAAGIGFFLALLTRR